jgi:hypothetical protein
MDTNRVVIYSLVIAMEVARPEEAISRKKGEWGIVNGREPAWFDHRDELMAGREECPPVAYIDYKVGN